MNCNLIKKKIKYVNMLFIAMHIFKNTLIEKMFKSITMWSHPIRVSRRDNTLQFNSSYQNVDLGREFQYHPKSNKWNHF